jgi:hypothetical protein
MPYRCLGHLCRRTDRISTVHEVWKYEALLTDMLRDERICLTPSLFPVRNALQPFLFVLYSHCAFKKLMSEYMLAGAADGQFQLAKQVNS